ncbi:MAG: spermidine synthase [Candidatus Dormibacteria bacterium]
MNLSRPVLALVFVSGMASMAIEMCASRLLAPYFGTSLYVWGVLIGLVLVYLSAGYWFGGRLADRRPELSLLLRITAWAGFLCAGIPVLSRPVLGLAQQGFSGFSVGLVVGSLVATVLLFAPAVVLLGMVSPFAIRLSTEGVERSGSAAGTVFALSTGGSILGTFVPVFYAIPTYGTRPTLFAFAAVLLGLSLFLLWPGSRRYLLLGLAAVVVAAASPLTGIRAPQAGTLLYEGESAYNYIQVTDVGGAHELILNEGFAVHSVYNPASLLTGGPWDFFQLGPLFHGVDDCSVFGPAAGGCLPEYRDVPDRIAVLGLAAGTTARQATAIYGAVPIDGVEIDPGIVDLGRRYFAMNEPNLAVHVDDARYWMATHPGRYRVIEIDAYRQPYIPFHLTTQEFFQLLRDHLERGGVVVINAGRTPTDYRLVDALARTLRSVFNQVWLVDPPRFSNTMIYAFDAVAFDESTFRQNLTDTLGDPGLPHPELLRQLGDAALVPGPGALRPWVDPHPGQPPFTDDLAPVEQLIDQIILGYLAHS